MKTKLRRGTAICCMAVFMVLTTCAYVKAYVLEPGWKVPFPKNIGVYIDSSLSDVNIKPYVKIWDTKTGRVAFNYTGSTVKFLDNRTVDNGTYATTFLQTGRQKNVIIYKRFKSLPTAHKNETIVHEVGHTLGLGHVTASALLSSSVMRETGFNNKAYPLSDDIAGIKAMY